MISASEFQSRLNKLMEYLISMKQDIFILESGELKNFSNDVFYPFRVNSDFYYLTGITEPNAKLVLEPKSNHATKLFLKQASKLETIWEGPTISIDEAKKISDIESIYNIEEFEKHDEAANHRYTKYLDANKLANNTNNILEQHKNAISFIHTLRSIKSSNEITLMQKSNDIAIQAHQMINQTITAGSYEYEIDGLLNQIFRSKGADSWAYPPIVASGNNSCILHYTKNNNIIKKDDVILVDAGCEYQMYASDITRVYSANDKFTVEQQDIYDICLSAQEESINTIKAGGSITETHEIATAIIGEGLKDLKYIKDAHDNNEVRKYFMHGIGHSLGIDVHDPGIDRNSDKYIPGMVFTVEPGIYIPEKSTGIRIEDNVVVTKDGIVNLTSNLSK